MFNSAANDKTKKAKMQADIVTVLSDNYVVPGVMQSTPKNPYI